MTIAPSTFHSLSWVDPAGIEDLLGRSYNLPAAFYVDPGLFAVEEELIFRRAWQVICTVRDLREAGDYVAQTINRIPVVVARQSDDGMKGFVNVCRHRGKTVVKDGRGSCRQFTCQYHARSYQLDGRFKGAPSEDAIGDTSGLGMRPISVDVWMGPVFVAIEPEQSLTEFLGDTPKMLAQNGSRMDFGDDTGLQFESDLTVNIKCNWKAWVENNHECYHCPTVHPTSLSAPFCADIAARFGRAFAEPNPEKPDLEQYYIWPN
jgi:phenylpropionate dioxygenase-like ring-hydroxylating dioxygenase large terminal subunit